MGRLSWVFVAWAVTCIGDTCEEVPPIIRRQSDACTGIEPGVSCGARLRVYGCVERGRLVKDGHEDTAKAE